jgi:hypothetical protein
MPDPRDRAGRQPDGPATDHHAGGDPEVDSPTHRAVDRLIDAVETATGPIADGLSAVIGMAADTIGELPGARVRRLRRLARTPLPSLPRLYPDAERARPVMIGLRSIPIDQIRGTAVAGGDQRGSDFLPLKPFRTQNWRARWQRLRSTQDSLAILPPIDVQKFDDGYWVVDGHNRVALALYGNQDEIDASVTELVPMGQTRTEPIGTLEAEVDALRDVRRRTQHEGRGQPPAEQDGDG